MSSNHWSEIFSTIMEGGNLEEQIQNALRDTLLPGRNTTANPSTTHNTRTSINQNATTSINQNINNERMLEIINNLAYDYNRNFYHYQERVYDILQLIQINQNNQINQINQNNEPNQRYFPTPHRNQSNNMFMSYVFYPLGGDTDISMNNHLLSREQIAMATQTYGYQYSQFDASDNVCPISLDTFQIGDVVCEIIGCGHRFKRPQLMNWLRRNSRCPVCRFDLHDEPRQHNTEQGEGQEPEQEGQGEQEQPEDQEQEQPEDQEQEQPEEQEQEQPEEQEQEEYTQNLNTLLPSNISELLLNAMRNHLPTSTFDSSGNEIYEFEFPLSLHR